jgi:hypothetical protein
MNNTIKLLRFARFHWSALVLAVGVSATASAQTASTPAAANTTAAASPAPPPAAPVKRSAADLEKLVAPIALYPDPVIATLLPASVYPLEIVQAARFVADTNNLAKLDAQPWDANVKAVARIPTVIKQMNDDLTWTMELGDAFLAQDKDVMDAIQAMRKKAQKAGTLQTTPQQIVTVTNMVTEKTVEQQVVVVTNTIVQIQPASSSVVYVPTYNPYVVYYPPPTYVANPYPLLTFGAGVAVGAIIANNCDWYHGGCYHGNVYVNTGNINTGNINRGNINTGNINSGNRVSNTQKWQPDQNRLGKSGSPTAANSARSAEARGWSSGGASAATANAGARTSAGTAAARPSTGAASANRAEATPSANRASPSQGVSQPRANQSASRPTASNSAFGGASSGASTRDYSNRGASSRSSGGFSGGGGSRGGGGRGGGGRR